MIISQTSTHNLEHSEVFSRLEPDLQQLMHWGRCPEERLKLLVVLEEAHRYLSEETPSAQKEE